MNIELYLPDQEIINKWIKDLDKNEDIPSVIEEARGTISNERIWLKGSDNEEQIIAHNQNIATLEEYIRRLQEIDIARRIWNIAKISPEYGNSLMDFLGSEIYDKVMKIQGGNYES